MQVLAPHEAPAWCAAHHVTLGNDRLPECSDANVRFAIPNDAEKRVYFVNRAMEAFRDEPLVLVWFHDWAVWPSAQRMHVLDLAQTAPWLTVSRRAD